MEIRVLRYYLAVAREGSITAAADFLHLTQPTLSRQIHDLEEELGQQLFVRGSHRVTLTRQGVLFRKRAEEIISMVDKTQEEFSVRSVLDDLQYGGIPHMISCSEKHLCSEHGLCVAIRQPFAAVVAAHTGPAPNPMQAWT